jgi:hypothetical protein
MCSSTNRRVEKVIIISHDVSLPKPTTTPAHHTTSHRPITLHISKSHNFTEDKLRYHSPPLFKSPHKRKNANTLFALLRVPQRTPRAMQIFPHLSMLDEYPSPIPIAKKRHLSTPITHTMQNYNIGKRVCGVSFYRPVYPLRRRTVATYPSS